MAALALRDVVKVYGRQLAVRGVDLDIPDKAFVVFVGPSGCGKSTILRMIAGLETISHGDLLIDGRVVNDAPARDRGVAMVFQTYALYPHMTVRENLAFSLKLARLPHDEMERRIVRAAAVLELEPYLEIKRLQRRLQTTTIYVTHDQIEAMTLADVIVVLKDGQIAQVGSPIEVFETPADLFVAGFIGTPQMNFFDGALARCGGDWRFENDTLSLPVAAGRYGDALVAGRRVWAGLRAEDFVPVGHGVRPKNAVTISGSVNLAEMLGSETLLFGVLGAESFVSRMQQPRLIEREEAMSFDVNVDRLHLFDC